MANFYLRQGDILPPIVATLLDDVGSPVDLTMATAVTFKMRRLDETALTVDAYGEITDAEAGIVSYAWQAGDTDEPAPEYLADWLVTFPSGVQSFPNPDVITIDITPSLANIPAISAADLARVRAAVGDAVPPTNIDIAMALARLGSAERVALEILETRYAAMVSGPSKFSIEGDASFDYTDTIKAMRAEIAGLRGGIAVADGTGGPITVSRLTRSDGWKR